VLPHRDTESGETLPVAEKVSRFRGSGTIDGTGQVASIVMPRRCRRALNAPLGRFFASLMPCSNLWIQKKNTTLLGGVLFGAAGEIRTLGTLLAYTRFPVVLVMTASILLRIGALDSKNNYTKNHSKVKHKFEKCAIF
jgi:hypothetical protein